MFHRALRIPVFNISFSCRRYLKQKSKAKVLNSIYQKNKEEKLMFGSVESLKEKRKKQKKSGTVQINGLSSEMFWLIQWNASKVKILKKKGNEEFLEISKEDALREICNGGLSENNQVVNMSAEAKPKRKKKKEGSKTSNEKLKQKEKLLKKPNSKKSLETEALSNCVENNNMETHEIYVCDNKMQHALTANNIVTQHSHVKTKIQVPDIFVRNITHFPIHINNNMNNSQLNEDQLSMLPSVTKILNMTMSDSSKAALVRWKTKMILELGEEEFQVYSQGLLQNGAMMHTCIKKYLEGNHEEIELNKSIEGCWSSLQHVLQDITDVKILEQEVLHPVLLYKGIVDCVAHYKGTPCVIEWKKSDKMKPQIQSTYDAPLQLCAYLGALSHDTRHAGDRNFDNGLVVVAYSDGTPAQVFPLNLESCLRYWNMWLQRLQCYWTTYNHQHLQQIEQNVSK